MKKHWVEEQYEIQEELPNIMFIVFLFATIGIILLVVLAS